MQVRIRYCRPCRYRLRAENLADLIRRTFGSEVVLEPGNFGVFKVWVDGDLVFDGEEAAPPYTTIRTGGCNATQIADRLGLGMSHYEYGITRSVRDTWIGSGR